MVKLNQNQVVTLARIGWSVFPDSPQCEQLKAEYNNQSLYRKTVVMARHRFGLGEYKYFNYPLPDIIQTIRTSLYPQLAPIANLWFRALNIDKQFPLVHAELQQQCHENGQQKSNCFNFEIWQRRFQHLASGFIRRCVFSDKRCFIFKRT